VQVCHGRLDAGDKSITIQVLKDGAVGLAISNIVEGMFADILEHNICDTAAVNAAAVVLNDARVGAPATLADTLHSKRLL
jgi:hypothetical protein